MSEKFTKNCIELIILGIFLLTFFCQNLHHAASNEGSEPMF